MTEPDSQTEFKRARDAEQASLAREFIWFMRENKKWWLLPILLILTVLSFLVMLSSTGVAPFIYTLF